MIRQTSIEAYQTIKENGLLSKRRMEVYEELYKNGPLTPKQISVSLKGHPNFGYWKRLSELREMGIVSEVGKVECPYTKQTVILWDVNDRLPEKIEKVKKQKTILVTKDQIHDALDKVFSEEQFSLTTVKELVSQFLGL